MTRRRIVVLAALAAPLVLFGVLTGAWAIDRSASDGQVMRNVLLAGTEVGGLDEGDLRSEIEDMTATFASTKVTLDADAFEVETTAGELGLTVDVDGTLRAAMAAGRKDPGPWSPVRWLTSMVADREVELRLSVDRSAVMQTVGKLEGDRRTVPEEPRVEATRDAITVIPGKNGIAIDVDAVADALPRSTSTPDAPIVVDAPRNETRPRITDETVAKLADAAMTTTAGDITLTYGDASTTIPGTDFRPGFRVLTDKDGARLDLDAQLVADVFARTRTTAYNPTGVTFDVVDGKPVPKAGHDAVVCCTDAAPSTIAAGLLAGQTTIALEARTVTAADGLAAAGVLGVNEVVGEFTTRHPAGQPRVKNIHRISDLTRGVLIAPGETWSVNEFVGRRTAEKGFVSAPVIEQGEFSTDIGGGVSQYATTLFNAAFFAGLDIPEHKAHSIYIDRYPFAREATLAYPSVDLKIRNNTPYAVMIWPTYTDTTITVQLFSTRHAVGVQESVTPARGCGKITLVRKRTFVDGTSDQQKYTANYDCDPPSHN